MCKKLTKFEIKLYKSTKRLFLWIDYVLCVHKEILISENLSLHWLISCNLLIINRQAYTIHFLMLKLV